jgi:hypothetical protein
MASSPVTLSRSPWVPSAPVEVEARVFEGLAVAALLAAADAAVVVVTSWSDLATVAAVIVEAGVVTRWLVVGEVAGLGRTPGEPMIVAGPPYMRACREASAVAGVEVEEEEEGMGIDLAVVGVEDLGAWLVEAY